MKYIARITKKEVFPEGEDIFSENGTAVFIDDQGGGEFVAIEQYSEEDSKQRINIDHGEWILIKEAVDQFFTDIAAWEKSE
jgi:hypothetical protein